MRRLEKNDLKALAELMGKRKDIVLAYVFGSQVSSTKAPGPSRDIDIAVLFDLCPSLKDLLRFRADLTRVLETDSVDLVSLNEAPPLLRFEAVVGGKTIYSRSSQSQSRFEMQAISHFLDTQYLRKVQNSYLLGGE